MLNYYPGVSCHSKVPVISSNFLTLFIGGRLQQTSDDCMNHPQVLDMIPDDAERRDF